MLIAALCACGGGGEPVGSASQCFNPQLYAVGTTYQLDYQLSGPLAGTLSRATSVQASGASGAGDRWVVTTTTPAYDPPVPGAGASRTRALLSVEGVDIVTRQFLQSFARTGLDNEIGTVYDPPFRDIRFSLAEGESFSLASDPPRTVTYAGQESVTVPAGTYTACRFDERASDGTLARSTWIAKGAGVPVRSVASGQVEELRTDLAGVAKLAR